jgi:glutathione S-transferase
MAEYVSVEEAKSMSGMRVVCAPGVPGPWAEAIKGILDVKKIPYARARFEIGGDHAALIAWTAQASAPAIAWNDEFPKSNWAEQLYLAERIRPDPPLVPRGQRDRILMFGLSNEICGMYGFGWSRRLMLVHQLLSTPGVPEESRALAAVLGAKYGYSPQAAAAAPARVVEVLDALNDQLESQAAKGSRYFIGAELSALDIYWAAFSQLIEPLAPDLCPMIEGFRPLYKCHDASVNAAATPRLMEHRDFIYREHLVLPVDL